MNSIQESPSNVESIIKQVETSSVDMVEDVETDKLGLGISDADTSMSFEQMKNPAKYDVKGLETSPQNSSQHKISDAELTPPPTPKRQKLSPVLLHKLSPVPSKRRSLLGNKANFNHLSIDGRDVTYSDTKVQRISKHQDSITDSELEAMTMVNNSDIETRGLDLKNGIDIPTVSNASLEELHVTATNTLELDIAVVDSSDLESQQHDLQKELEILAETNQSLEEIRIPTPNALDTPDETTTGVGIREFEMMPIKIPDAKSFSTQYGETLIDNGITPSLEFGRTMDDGEATEKKVTSPNDVTSGSDISEEAMTSSEEVKNSIEIARNEMNEKESESTWQVVEGTEFGICRTEANQKLMGGRETPEMTLKRQYDNTD